MILYCIDYFSQCILIYNFTHVDSERCHQSIGIEDGFIEDFQLNQINTQAEWVLVPDATGGKGNYGWCTSGRNNSLFISVSVILS